MNSSDGHWLSVELDDCVDSWSAATDTEGPNSRAAILWQGRVDEAVRMALHFGLIGLEEARRRVATGGSDPGALRAFGEPDGEDGD